MSTIGTDCELTESIIFQQVGGGSGSGLILLLIICVCLYWRCKKSQYCCARSASHASYTDPENQNMMYTRGGAIRSSMGSDLAHKTVRF